MQQALTEPAEVDIRHNGEQALTALRAAAVVGVRVPNDLSIGGVDGIWEALLGSTRLTTISLPLAELAIRAFEVLQG